MRYGKDFEQIHAFFGAEKPIYVITLAHVGKFYKSPELLILSNGKDRTVPTVKKTVRILRMWLTWLREQGHIQTITFPKEKPFYKGRTINKSIME